MKLPSNNQRTPARITRDFVIDLVSATNEASKQAENLRVELALTIATLKVLKQSQGAESDVLAGVIRNLEGIVETAEWLEASLSTKGFFGGAA